MHASANPNRTIGASRSQTVPDRQTITVQTERSRPVATVACGVEWSGRGARSAAGRPGGSRGEGGGGGTGVHAGAKCFRTGSVVPFFFVRIGSFRCFPRQSSGNDLQNL